MSLEEYFGDWLKVIDKKYYMRQLIHLILAILLIYVLIIMTSLIVLKLVNYLN